MADEIDRSEIAPLALKLSTILCDDLSRRPPPSRETLLLHLNAVAGMLALVFAGTAADPAAIEFFRAALAANLRRACEEFDIAAPLPNWLADGPDA